MNTNPTLEAAEFQKLVESLCAAASADFAAARQRLERLRRVGPDEE